MTKPVVIVGGGRQGRNIAEILERTATTALLAGFLDDTKPSGSTVLGYPVVAGFAAMRDPAFVRDHSWIVSLGDNLSRRELCRLLADAGAEFVNALHPSAQISRSAVIGRGVWIGALSTVLTGCAIGDWVAVDVHSILGSDVRVGEAAFVGPGSILTGGSAVGARTFLGAAATVSNNVTIGADCVVGANSLVLRDVPDGASVSGTPAQPTRLRRRPLMR
jgi:sugar O-acyltransferase (sialic acid O-acetyltransferase NeuD family)